MIKDNTPDDVKQALEQVIQTCAKHGALVAGFVWQAGDSPFIVRFGNVREEKKELNRLFSGLCELSSTKHAAGLVVHHKVGDVN